jgi:TolB-like protein/Flp pilus assembly protein TadD
VQNGMIERNTGVPPERRIELRVGIHCGDVVEESDGDLMGDGVNIAARLESICAPNGICLSEDAYRQVKSRLDIAVTDLGEKQLKNLAHPMRVYSVKAGVVMLAKPGATQLGALSSPPHLSIVVLPFANLGGDPEQEYFVDGVTESLTTDLSRISGSFVIGRSTAYTYKGRHVDLRQIGRELNVRYILEGSVQRSGSRLRANVQLIDAVTGAHLWAERFDSLAADLFEMQDEIVARLANQSGTELIAAEARRAEQAPHADSMDFYFQGRACLNKGNTPEHLTQASRLFEQALALDPCNVEALVSAAFADVLRGSAFLADDRAMRFARAEAALTKALSQAPNHPWAHHLSGAVQIQTNRAVQGITECERSLALDRNLAMAHGWIGLAKYFLGRSEETEAHVQEALRLSPRDTHAYAWALWVGLAKLALGADDEAVTHFRRGIEVNRNVPFAHFALGAALAQVGRIDEARAAAQAGIRLDPTFTIHRLRTGVSSDNAIYLARRGHLIEGMRKAGLPET